MRKIHLLLVHTLLFVVGCQESTNTTNADSQNEINGQFINWDADSSSELYWIVQTDTGWTKLIESSISEDGRFNSLLPTPPNEILKSYEKLARDDSVYVGMEDSIIFSEGEAKYIRLSLGISYRITIGTSCGNTVRFDTSSIVGDYQIYYYYFDRSINVNGNWKIHFFEEFYPNYARTIITKYNDVQFSQGWNQIVARLVKFESDEKVFEVSNEDREMTEWMISAALSEFLRLL